MKHNDAIPNIKSATNAIPTNSSFSIIAFIKATANNMVETNRNNIKMNIVNIFKWWLF